MCVKYPGAFVFSLLPNAKTLPFSVVGARLQRDVGDRAAGAAELRVVGAGADVHRLDRLGRRNQRRQQSGAVVVVDAFDLDVVREPRLAVDVGREAVLRVEEVGVRPLDAARRAP